MKKAPITLQDLRRRMYRKAKSEETWRFWGLYCHVCKMETLQEAYRLAKVNGGAPGIDGVTFEDIERSGVQSFLDKIRTELVEGRYLPLPNRTKSIPKPGTDKVRTLGIPCIKDRVVQGALKLILEPIFEADFPDGSYGFRPKRSQHQAVQRVLGALTRYKTTIIDLDLSAYFDNIRHHLLLQKVSVRVQDPEIMRLLKLILKAAGKKGVPQGGVISPLLSNIYLLDVDRMLEKATQVTRDGKFTSVCYARFADDLVVLVSGRQRHKPLGPLIRRRLNEEFAKLEVTVNEEKSRELDLYREPGSSFGFLGFDFRLVQSSRTRKLIPFFTPKTSKRTEILREVKQTLRSNRYRKVNEAINLINPMLAGWANYFRVSNCSGCFGYVRWTVEKMVRRFMARSQKRSGLGWKRWSYALLYTRMGLYNKYGRARLEPKFV